MQSKGKLCAYKEPHRSIYERDPIKKNRIPTGVDQHEKKTLKYHDVGKEIFGIVKIFLHQT